MVLGPQFAALAELDCTTPPPLRPTGNQEGSTVWSSEELTTAKLPLRFKFVANGHRSSPNT